MRVLIFHGYLLRGTGSNVYNARLASTLARLGHEVHLLCQDRAPAAAGVDGERITVYTPEIGPILPVYVADRYDGFAARTFLECSDDEIAAYVDANVAAVAEVAARVRPDVALANHLVMGPAILSRALGDDVPYAVKIHGSALEYVVKRDPDRFGPYAREGLARARTILVGSLHTAASLWDAVDDPSLAARTRLGPPGVDIEQFVPRARDEAARRVAALAQRLEASTSIGTGSFARDDAAAGRALAALDPASERLVLFVGKLIVAKGVDLLVAAWPHVLARVPDARLVVVGFGAYRAGLERLVAALASGDVAGAVAIAHEGREAEGGEKGTLSMLAGFLERLEGADRDQYLAAASRLPERLTIVGRVDHDELAELLPLCEAQVVPSTFPESFGMVAAEAAASGVLPVSASHSGLREVTATLASAVPAEARELLSFDLRADAVEQLADRLVRWLEAPEELREATREALVRTAREHFSWEGVARGVLAAAEGRLDALVPPS